MDTDWIFRREPKPKPTLEQRVIRAAEAALEDHQSVSAIDVLEQIQLVANVGLWRKGHIPTLEQEMQGSYEKVARSLAIFERWAKGHGLEPVPIRYVTAPAKANVNCSFSAPDTPAWKTSSATSTSRHSIPKRRGRNSRSAPARPLSASSS